MRSYFIWRGQDSRDWGIYLKAPAPIIRAKERVTSVVIPGRAGSYHILEGDGILDTCLQSIVARVPQAAIDRGALSWLSGSGYLTFSTLPDRRQQARLINQVQLQKLSYNLGWFEGTLAWECQPYKELLHEPTDVLLSSGSALKNLGDVPERPLFTVTGSGDFALTVNGETFTITGITAEQGGAVIDCDACEVSTPAGELITIQSAGAFPELAPGVNSVSWTGSGITQVTALRRQRWL